jgi:hypothetical protein
MNVFQIETAFNIAYKSAYSMWLKVLLIIPQIVFCNI